MKISFAIAALFAFTSAMPLPQKGMDSVTNVELVPRRSPIGNAIHKHDGEATGWTWFDEHTGTSPEAIAKKKEEKQKKKEDKAKKDAEKKQKKEEKKKQKEAEKAQKEAEKAQKEAEKKKD